MLKKVLITQSISEAGMQVLAGQAEPVIAPDPSADTIRSLLPDVEGVILRTSTHFSEELIAAGAKLKVISRTGVGVDNVDVQAATARGIRVCHTPGVNAASVAEQTVALILALAKQLKAMNVALSHGDWNIRNAYTATDLDGKVLGLVGLGRVGLLVAAKCRGAFNMKVLAFDPNVHHAEGVEFCESIERLFTEADFVSLHLPYTQSTRHVVGRDLLGRMKPGAYLINTARGAIVDEGALIEAVKTGRIAGAGLDVFEPEPPNPDNPLLHVDGVIATPHCAALSRECVIKVAMAAAQAVVDVFSDKEPAHVFNREALGKAHT